MVTESESPTILDRDESILSLRSRVRNAVSYHLSRSPGPRDSRPEPSAVEPFVISYSTNQSERLKYVREKKSKHIEDHAGRGVAQARSTPVGDELTQAVFKHCSRRVAQSRVIKSKVIETQNLIEEAKHELVEIERKICKYEGILHHRKSGIIQNHVESLEGPSFEYIELEPSSCTGTEISGIPDTSNSSQVRTETQPALESKVIHRDLKSPTGTLLSVSEISTQSRRSIVECRMRQQKGFTPKPIKIQSNSYYMRMCIGSNYMVSSKYLYRRRFSILSTDI